MFYIIEKQSQLEYLYNFGDCFINFIPYNDYYHPFLNKVSLIYLHPVNSHKGYMICIKHNESFSLNIDEVKQWINKNTDKLFVQNKKEALYYFDNSDKLFDLNFIESVSYINNNKCHRFYYSHHNISDINCLIPISKHYEECEKIYNICLPIIKAYKSNKIYDFNNKELTNVFYYIEKNGIKIDKNEFISFYKDKPINFHFNISKSKIYTHYNLYTTTGRPSNSFNGINFAALNKTDGERLCYIPENDLFIEFDFQGYHPRLAASLVGLDTSNESNIYEYLGVEKKEMFENLYGGIKPKNLNKPFFNKINNFIEDMWDTYQFGTQYETPLRVLYKNDGITYSSNKLFNYLLQSKETYENVNQLNSIISLLENKKTKLVLYTYDAFLFDYNKEDGNELLSNIKNTLKYPVNIKQGKTYHALEKI